MIKPFVATQSIQWSSRQIAHTLSIVEQGRKSDILLKHPSVCFISRLSR